MLGPIIIRQRSKELLHNFKSASSPLLTENLSEDSEALLNWIDQIESQAEINIVELAIWLNKTTTLDNETQLLLEALRASLLADLYHSIPETAEFYEYAETPSNYELFRFLTIAGTIVAICEGFDGIVSILGLFPFVPATPIFFVGIIFAALSVIVFRGFDLIAMAKNLGVEMDTAHGVDVFLEQVAQVAKLTAVISLCCTEEAHEQDHVILLQLSTMLTTRFEALETTRRLYKEDLNSPYLRTAKSFTSAIAGVLFFGSGFVSGQSVFLAIASLFTTSVSALFWPVLTASFIVGVAAFSIYWFVERPGLESLVSRWLDIDEDKIHALVDDNVVMEQRRDLDQLAKQVAQVGRLHQQAPRFINTTLVRNPLSESIASDNVHSFFNARPRAKSLSDLDERVIPDHSFHIAMA